MNINSKIKFLYYFFLALFIFINNNVEAFQSSADEIRENGICLDEINQEIEQALKVFNMPGAAVGVIVDSKIILSKGYGYRDLTLKLPVTEDTIFGIGSCTKAFTAFILGQLVDEKIISWDDPIVKYIPELCLWDKCTTQSTTVRDLLAHRTGFSGHDFLAFNIHLNRKDLVECLQYLEPVDSFRNSYHYSNIMYALAGHLIERVTGMTWEIVVKEKILKPLMMNNSCFHQSDVSENSSANYFYLSNSQSFVSCPAHKITFIAPAYGIKSSASDMLKWLQLNLSGGTLFNKKFISNPALQEMHTPQIIASASSLPPVTLSHYGLGWRIGYYNEIPLIMHGGTSDGFQTQILLLPSKKIGIIVLTNCTLILNHRLDTQKYFINAVSNIILDKLLNNSKSDWISKFFQIYEQNKPVILESKEENGQEKVKNYPNCNDYLGAYEHPGYGIIQINAIDEHLTITYGDLTSPLQHEGNDCFVGIEFAFSGKSFKFSRDEFNNINRLYSSLEPKTKAIEFRRKKQSD